jgi:hypothetical protein
MLHIKYDRHLRKIQWEYLAECSERGISFVAVPPTQTGLSGSMTNSRYASDIHADASSGIYASIWHGGFPEEPSLFEELGIQDTNIVNNLKVILLPRSDVQTVDDNFLVGMLIFCFFASSLLVLGKVRFGMVYMIGIFGFVLLYHLFKFMSPEILSMGHLFTALSYCTIPLIPIVLFVGLLRLRATSTTTLSMPFVFWSAFSATRYLMTRLKFEDIRVLVFIPLFLFYAFLFLLPIY